MPARRASGHDKACLIIRVYSQKEKSPGAQRRTSSSRLIARARSLLGGRGGRRREGWQVSSGFRSWPPSISSTFWRSSVSYRPSRSGAIRESRLWIVLLPAIPVRRPPTTSRSRFSFSVLTSRFSLSPTPLFHFCRPPPLPPPSHFYFAL